MRAALMRMVFFLIIQPLSAQTLFPEQDPYCLGMGNAAAAVAGGTHAIQLNPAGIARASVPMVQLGGGFQLSPSNVPFQTSVLYPLADGTVFALSQFSEFPESFPSNTVYMGSAALPLNSSRDFFLGANVKYIVLSSLFGSTPQGGRGLGFDFGLAYDLRGSKGTLASFALAIKDLNSQIRYENMAERTLLRTVVLGAAYQELADTRFEADCGIIDPTMTAQDHRIRIRVGAERFFARKVFSVRAGYDDVLGQDGLASAGAGYHPAQPFEITYALRISPKSLQSAHYLSFVYRLDKWTSAGPARPGAGVTTASVIQLQPSTSAFAPAVTPEREGRPVSSVPLRRLAFQIDPAAFSPEGKNKATTISFPRSQSADIAAWSVEFQNTSQKTVRRIDGNGQLLPQIVWDGLDGTGTPVLEGKYQVILRSYDKNQELLSMDSETVEVVKPHARFVMRASGTYFSAPAGRQLNRNALFTIDADGSPEVQSWQFEVREASTGRWVVGFTGKNLLPKTYTWDGRNSNRIIADGKFLCNLSAVDKAGNPLKTVPVRIVISSAPAKLTLSPENQWADFALQNSFDFMLDTDVQVGIQSWKVDLQDETGKMIRSFVGNGQPPEKVSWNGETAEGKALASGSMVKAIFSVVDKAGNASSTDAISVQLAPPAFSSNEQMTLKLTSVFFDENSYQLNDNAKKELDKSVLSIRPYLEKSVLVVRGYASPDETGDLTILSRQRAVEVRNYLAKILGVPIETIYAVGYAEQNAESESGSTAGENRRRAVVTLSTR
jgi:outer membrane protein OmpA-like peptidoglycan-associated protein